MHWVKKLWSPVAAVVLVAVIGFNVYRIIDYRRAGGDAPADGVASQGSGTRGETGRNNAPVPDLVGSPSPRQLTLRVQPTNGDNQPTSDQLTAALQAIGPVDQASVEGDALKLTIADSLDLSELVERLGFQNTALVEDQCPIAGGLRLKVAGMT